MIELSEILPAPLRAAMSDDDNDQNLLVDSISFFKTSMTFTFSICDDRTGRVLQKWQMKVLNYRDSKIELHGGYGIALYSDHYLLWPYTDAFTDLYFRKTALNPKELFTDIYLLHHNSFEDFLPVEKYINTVGGSMPDKIFKIFTSNYGLFARGPRKIMEQYFICLERAGCDPYFQNFSGPKKSAEKDNNAESNPLKLAFCGGSYFIGTDFIFTQTGIKTWLAHFFDRIKNLFGTR